MSQTLVEARYRATDLRKVANKEANPQLKRHFSSQADLAEAHLDRLTSNDSAFKPLRTPWKRIEGLGSKRYFEEL